MFQRDNLRKDFGKASKAIGALMKAKKLDEVPAAKENVAAIKQQIAELETKLDHLQKEVSATSMWCGVFGSSLQRIARPAAIGGHARIHTSSFTGPLTARSTPFFS